LSARWQMCRRVLKRTLKSTGAQHTDAGGARGPPR
jgi:hypothetical protein